LTENSFPHPKKKPQSSAPPAQEKKGEKKKGIIGGGKTELVNQTLGKDLKSSLEKNLLRKRKRLNTKRKGKQHKSRRMDRQPIPKKRRSYISRKGKKTNPPERGERGKE